MSWHLCGTQLEGSCEGRSQESGVQRSRSAFDTSSHPHAFAA
jgi:hypothetical protein